MFSIIYFCVFSVIFLRFGRRFATILSLFGLFLCGVGTAFSPNIYVYMIVKFFCGVTGVLVMQATVIGKYMPPQISNFSKEISDCLQRPCGQVCGYC